MFNLGFRWNIQGYIYDILYAFMIFIRIITECIFKKYSHIEI